MAPVRMRTTQNVAQSNFSRVTHVDSTGKFGSPSPSLHVTWVVVTFEEGGGRDLGRRPDPRHLFNARL